MDRRRLNEIGNTYLGLVVANMLLCSWASGVKALLSNGTENWQTWSVLPVKIEESSLALLVIRSASPLRLVVKVLKKWLWRLR